MLVANETLYNLIVPVNALVNSPPVTAFVAFLNSGQEKQKSGGFTSAEYNPDT